MKSEEEIRIRLVAAQKLRGQIGKRIDKDTASYEDYTVDDQLEGAIPELEWVLGEAP